MDHNNTTGDNHKQRQHEPKTEPKPPVVESATSPSFLGSRLGLTIL
ncbi:hypothetical protein [Arthrobacter sp. UYCu712]